jgi:mannosyl-3-phosphoglycerate phosphatase
LLEAKMATVRPGVGLVVVTDVDACLIDRDTYSPGASAEALGVLQRRQVPVILCSSKTREELEDLRRQLGLEHPFISENGAALYVPDGYFPFPLPAGRRQGSNDVVAFGRPRIEVTAALEQVARELPVEILSFSRMNVRQVADETGLSVEAAALAQRRQYDEPFRVVDSDPRARARLVDALAAAGIRVVAGGRYDHALAGADKGRAARFLMRLYRKALGAVTSIGLGDSLNDVPLLQAVDIPVIVRSAEEGVSLRVRNEVPRATITRLIGPAGWSEAILELLAGGRRDTRDLPES